MRFRVHFTAVYVDLQKTIGLIVLKHFCETESFKSWFLLMCSYKGSIVCCYVVFEIRIAQHIHSFLF